MDLERYNPLDQHPALFRAFVETPATRDGVLKFACKYGQLELPRETLQAWREEIQAMHDAVSLWDLIRGGDKQGLRQRIRHSTEGIQYVGPHRQEVIAHAGSTSHERLASHFPMEGAVRYLQQTVNKRPEQGAALRLLRTADPDLLGLFVVPRRSLLGALWFQFAHAIGTLSIGAAPAGYGSRCRCVLIEKTVAIAATPVACRP